MAKRISIELFMALVIGLVLGLFGPFGTFAMAPAARIAFWMVYIVIGYAIFRPMVVLGLWMSEALSISRVIGVGLALAVAAVPLTFMIALLFAGFDVTGVLTASGLPLLYLQVWLIGFLVNGFFMLVFRKETAATPAPHAPRDTPEPPPPAPAPSRLAARLPAGFGPVLALKGEDHYVRVYADQRDHLLLLRLRDAVAEHDGEGQMVHRSWWVARAAVTGLARDGRNARLVLTNGLTVPVSRDGVPVLRQAGWPLRPPPPAGLPG